MPQRHSQHSDWPQVIKHQWSEIWPPGLETCFGKAILLKLSIPSTLRLTKVLTFPFLFSSFLSSGATFCVNPTQIQTLFSGGSLEILEGPNVTRFGLRSATFCLTSRMCRVRTQNNVYKRHSNQKKTVSPRKNWTPLLINLLFAYAYVSA